MRTHVAPASLPLPSRSPSEWPGHLVTSSGFISRHSLGRPGWSAGSVQPGAWGSAGRMAHEAGTTGCGSLWGGLRLCSTAMAASCQRVSAPLRRSSARTPSPRLARLPRHRGVGAGPAGSRGTERWLVVACHVPGGACLEHLEVLAHLGVRGLGAGQPPGGQRVPPLGVYSPTPAPSKTWTLGLGG